MDDADPVRILGTGPFVRAARDRSGPPEDGGPDRLPPAAPAERPVRHDRLEGVRAHEGPRGPRPDQPQALRTVPRPDDDAVFCGILRTEVHGPRRDPPTHGGE